MEPFVSYAQNGEDVVLARALRSVQHGRYVDVGANDPVTASVTYAFYDRGWTGIVIEPVPMYAHRLRERRPRDRVLEVAITDLDTESVTLHQIPNSGLSTLVDDVSHQHECSGWEVQDLDVSTRRLDAVLDDAGWAGKEIHFVVIDTEGSELGVLRSIDLQKWRPWIFVVEATRPLSNEPSHGPWEPILEEAGYQFCLFDGLSRFYVANEKADELAAQLRAPANAHDHFVPYETLLLEQERDGAVALMRKHDEEQQDAILQWRAAAVSAWVTSAAGGSNESKHELLHQIHQHVNHIQYVEAQVKDQRAAINAMQRTLSWRVTRPLRSVRSRTRRSGER